MKTALIAGIALGALVISAEAAQPKPLRAVSEITAGGFEFPESVVYDPKARALYVGNFGGAKLDPAAKNGLGRISKVGLDGKIIDAHFLPTGNDKLNAPKGLWVRGTRLWVPDIDAVWIFDTKTRKGRKLDIPTITFANDTAVMGKSLYVSDNRSDRIYRIEPADFLDAKVTPQISVVLAGKSAYPNGIWPGRHGELLIVGFQSPKEPRGIYSIDKHGEFKEIAKSIGRLDGLYQMKDGSILYTDWETGSLSHWKGGQIEKLATGFKGPADFTVIDDRKGMTVVVPDLVQSQIRIVKLGR